MSKYTFTFKKDDISVEFTTTDKEIVAKQFKIWVDEATEYTKNHPTEEKKTLDTVEKTQEPQEACSKKEPEQVSPAEPVPSVSVVENQTKTEAEKEPKVDKFDKASELLKKVEQIDLKQAVIVPTPVVEPIPEREVSEAIENTVQNEEISPVTINSIQNPTPTAEEVPDFGKVLEQKIENPTFEPAPSVDTRFIDFVNAKNTKDKLHYLIITAFYFLQFNKIESFSLKQINSKLMHNISELIDHSVIQDAINRQLIEVLPDLTGASEVSEYRLTEKGEDFFINGLR